MKKLIIAAAIICTAIVTQAAAFSWTTSDKAYGPTAEAIAGMKNGDILSNGTSSNEYIKNLSILTWTADITLTKGAASETITASGWGYSSNKINATGLESTIFDGLGDDPSVISWSVVIKGTAANGNYITSEALTGSAEFTKLSALSFKTAAASTWTATAAAPEPTSGILLLLGMAGLALKRKRA